MAEEIDFLCVWTIRNLAENEYSFVSRHIVKVLKSYGFKPVYDQNTCMISTEKIEREVKVLYLLIAADFVKGMAEDLSSSGNDAKLASSYLKKNLKLSIYTTIDKCLKVPAREELFKKTP